MTVDSIHGLLLESIRRFAERPAMAVGNERRTYRSLGTEVYGLASSLVDLEVRRGDRVVYWGPSHLEAYELLLACSVIGAVFVPANPKFRAREIQHVLDLSEPQLLVIGGHDDDRGGFRERVAEVLEQWGRGQLLLSETRIRGLGGRPHKGVSPLTFAPGETPQTADHPGRNEPALMQFTSGTTGRPKGALVGQAATTRMATALAESFGLSDADTYFVCNPICHLGGTTFSFLAAIRAGACFVTLPTFDADTAIRIIEEEPCTVVHGIDTHWVTLLDAAERAGLRGSIRVCSIGAPLQIVERARAVFAPQSVMTGYGSTETGGCPIESHYLDDQSLVPSRNGRPLAGVTLSIVDPVTDEELDVRQQGEIRIGGWSLMLGYHKDEAATAAQLDTRGRCRTGDVGFLDENGFLHFVGRIKNVIRVGGENVAAEEVESVLQAHEAIRYAVVVPRPDPTRGEVPVAYIVRDPNASLTEVDAKRYCLSKLASFKVPVAVNFIDADEMPLTDSGKIARATVTSWAAGRPVDLGANR